MPDRAKHISSSFDAALYGLKNDVLMMSSLTDRIFQTAFEALLKRDSELCDHVVAEDEEIDILEKQIDQDGVSLLLRFRPVASDMRQVVSAMKISTNLERIADQSVTMARRAKHLNNRPAVREVPLLEPAYRLAVAIFRDSMRTFADGDCKLERTLKLKDRQLDTVTCDLSEKIIARATRGPGTFAKLRGPDPRCSRPGADWRSWYKHRGGFFLARPSHRHSSYLRTTERSLIEVSI